MRKLISILLLLCPLLAYSQGFTPRRPFVLQSASVTNNNPYPMQVAGLAYWWNQIDKTNDTAMTNWIDRIQQFPQTNGTAADRPTYDVTNKWVRYAGTKYMTNESVTLAAGSCVFFILRWTDTSQVLSPYFTYNVPLATAFRMYTLMSTAQTNNYAGSHWGEQVGATDHYGLIDGGGTVPNNQTITLCSVNTTTNTIFYTNGVQSRAILTGGAEKWNEIGGDHADGWKFAGDIREVLIYTNILDGTIVSNLHYYATTNYPGMP